MCEVTYRHVSIGSCGKDMLGNRGLESRYWLLLGCLAVYDVCVYVCEHTLPLAM